MPSSLWFSLRDSGCFSFENRRAQEREAQENHRNYVESRNGCHDVKGSTLSKKDSEGKKDE